jgi:fumarylacetoacetase
MAIDETHDINRRSWVSSANSHPDFPIQNLPLGVFSPPAGPARVGVAIGEEILDLAAVADAGLLSPELQAMVQKATGSTLNALMALGKRARISLRRELSALLYADGPQRQSIEALVGRLLFPAAACTLHLPSAVGNYTDFFAGIYHATATGRLFRPTGEPLQPNYKYVPVAYHGRASSVRVSPTNVRRPSGQRSGETGGTPSFGPCLALDYELEFGIWIGPGNALGEPIAIHQAAEHVFGFCLLNDWSARDIQRWESMPLGPFLAKNFATTVSPWIVTVEALAPFRVAQQARPQTDPPPLGYLWDDDDQRSGAADVALEVFMMTDGLKAKGLAPHRMSRANTRDLYWTFAQMVAHHTCTGCNLEAGDLFGSGTISGAAPDAGGSLLERSQNGRNPVALGSGEGRTFLQDGDEVIFRATCRRDGFAPIGFGECRGRIVS